MSNAATVSSDGIRTSDTITTLAPALLAVQKAVEDVEKSADNPYFKSKYADLPSVLEAAKPHLNLNGIALLQFPSPAPEGHLGLTTRLLHTSGEWIESTAVTPLAKADPQGYGSAITYLRRYAIQSILGFAAVDDDGESASGRGGSPPPRQRVASPDEGKTASQPAAAPAKTGGFPKAGAAAQPAAKAPARPKGALFPKMGGKREPIDVVPQQAREAAPDEPNGEAAE